MKKHADWWHRAQDSIAQGCLTNSKHPQSMVYGCFPTHVSHGHGCYLYADDTKYIDYICGLGANLFGYGCEHITREIISLIYGGVSHSLPTVHEVEAAEALKSMFVFTDRWKFLKTGSEACAAAVKIARAATGRKLVLSEGYHGHADMFVSLTPPASGVRDLHYIANLENINYIDEQVACVIVEPVQTDDSKERIDWLNKLRAKCDETGALLIFDEVITGFRYPKFGVCNAYNIRPDLIILGKAMANGFPLAAVGGKAELMDHPTYFVSSTYAGDILSLAACKAVVKLCQKNTDFDLDQLIGMAKQFQKEVNQAACDFTLKGYGTRMRFDGDKTAIAIFMQEMARAGILFNMSPFYNYPLMAVQDEVLDTVHKVCDDMRRGSVSLDYPLPTSPFADRSRKA